MKKATLDPAKNLDLYFRKLRAGSKVLAFFNQAGDDYDIEAIDFTIWGIDATLTKSGNELTIVKGSDIVGAQCFWELVNATDNKTWLTGTAFYLEGLSAEVDDTEEQITIALNGETVNIVIAAGTGTGDLNGGTP